MKHIAIAALMCSIFYAGASPSMAAANTSTTQKIREKQTLIEATRHKLEAKRGQLHTARFKVQTIAQALHETHMGIGRVRGELDVLAWEIGRTEARLAVKRKQLTAARASLERHRGALGRRLIGIYEYGTASYLEVLLNATSFTDFIERWDFLRYIIKADAALISQINVARANYAHAVDDLETTQRTLDAQRSDQVRKREQLAMLAEQRRVLLTQAQGQRNQIAQEVDELEELTAAQEARLQELIRQRQIEVRLATERARRAAAEARRAAAIAAGLPPPVERPLGVPSYFVWPAVGPVTSPFGMRVNPVTGRYRLHSGIDIGASYGASIGASADGVVIFAGWYGGYGEAIIIDHGAGLSTLYAHCSAIYVGVNQPVQRSQVIGAVGSTGNSTGPHLHFEIRVNGVPVNPMTRL